MSNMRVRSMLLVTAIVRAMMFVPFDDLALGAEIRGVHCADAMIPGRLEYRLQPIQSGSYAIGKPIAVEVLLTNLSTAPVEVCDDCVAEGLRIVHTLTPPACGVFADHMPGYSPKMLLLGPGKSLSKLIILTDMPCAPDQPGRYEVRSTYMFHSFGREHQTDPPDYCIAAKPLQIDVVRK